MFHLSAIAKSSSSFAIDFKGVRTGSRQTARTSVKSELRRLMALYSIFMTQYGNRGADCMGFDSGREQRTIYN